MNSGIYFIRNTKNGKFYIGSAVDFTKRKREHFWYLRKGTHPNKHLQSAWNIYGEKYFAFEIVHCCEISILKPIEQGILNIFCGTEQCYNIAKDAYSPSRGRKNPCSEEKKIKLREARKSYKATEETNKKISETLKGRPSWNKGKKLSEQHKANLRGPRGKNPIMSKKMIGNKNAVKKTTSTQNGRVYEN